MYRGARIELRFPNKITDRDIVQASAIEEVNIQLKELWDACYMDKVGKSKAQQVKKCEKDNVDPSVFAFEDIKKRVSKWDRRTTILSNKFGSDIDYSDVYRDNDWIDLLRKYYKNNAKMKTMRRMSKLAYAQNEMLDAYMCKCWEREYDRLVIQIHMFFMQLSKSSLELPKAIQDSISQFYHHQHYSRQDRHVMTWHEIKEAEKEKSRKSILGLAIDELLRDTKIHPKIAISRAIEKWTGCRKRRGMNNQKKQDRRRENQNTRRRLFPKGIAEEQVFQYVLTLLKDDKEKETAKEDLKNLKSDLKGRDLRNVALSKAQARVFYQYVTYMINHKDKLKQCDMGRIVADPPDDQPVQTEKQDT